jgi:hypothetical protein
LIVNPTTEADPRRALLAEVAVIATALQADVMALVLEVQKQVARFKADEISFDEATFWLKSLVGSFFTYADGLTYSIRANVASSANFLGDQLSRSLRRDLDTSKRLPLERAVLVALKSLASLCSIAPVVNTGNEDFRGFKALMDARERFVHPKNHTDVWPVEILPTFKPALEWFFHTWRDTLIACGSAIGFPLPSAPQTQRFSFRDDSLAPFIAKRREWEEQRETGFVPDLRDVVFPLMDDTGRAMDALLGRRIETVLPKDCAARNLVRMLFVEVEGTTLIVASLINKYDNGEAPSGSLLVGPHEQVRTNIIALLERFSSRFGRGRRIPQQGKGWEAFPTARALRNRVTHPKSARDLTLDSQDLDMLIELAGWWHGHADACLELEPTCIPA